MKKTFISICKWAAGLLLVSIAGSCSASHKAAKTPEASEEAVPAEEDVVPAEEEKVAPSDTTKVIEPGSSVKEPPIMLLYGVRFSEYEKKVE